MTIKILNIVFYFTILFVRVLFNAVLNYPRPVCGLVFCLFFLWMFYAYIIDFIKVTIRNYRLFNTYLAEQAVLLSFRHNVFLVVFSCLIFLFSFLRFCCTDVLSRAVFGYLVLNFFNVFCNEVFRFLRILEKIPVRPSLILAAGGIVKIYNDYGYTGLFVARAIFIAVGGVSTGAYFGELLARHNVPYLSGEWISTEVGISGIIFSSIYHEFFSGAYIGRGPVNVVVGGQWRLVSFEGPENGLPLPNRWEVFAYMIIFFIGVAGGSALSNSLTPPGQ